MNSSATQLCQTCQNIEFSSLVWRTVQFREAVDSFFNRPSKIRIGSIRDVRRRSFTCGMCRVIASRLDQVDDPDTEQHPDDQCVLTTSNLSTGRGIEDSNKPFEPYLSAKLVYVQISPAASIGFVGPVLPDRYFKDGIQNPTTKYSAPAQTRPWGLMTLQACIHPVPDVDSFCREPIKLLPPAMETKFSGRTRKAQVNRHLPHRWWQLCQKFHGHDCKLALPTVVDDFRVIDVHDMAVVLAPKNCEYVALSYCWGSASTILLKRVNLVRLAVPNVLRGTVLPNTISDAIEVTRHAGIRYLWVDALCIVQDDTELLQKQIPLMGRIYEQGAFTIIAANAENADAGLAGVRPGTRSVACDIVTLKNLSLITIPEETTRDARGLGSRSTLRRKGLQDSRWRSRAWTMQEELFSRRRLYFEQDRIFWWCPNGVYQEDTVKETFTLLTREHPSFLGMSLRMPRDMMQAELTHEIYGSLVSEYARRFISFPSDSLNAFAGMTSKLCEQHGFEVFWGHPRQWFLNSLSWVTIEEATQNHGKQKVVTSNGEEVDIPFPSWSWSAWIGHEKVDLTWPPKPNGSCSWAALFYRCHRDVHGELIPYDCINQEESSSYDRRADVMSPPISSWIGFQQSISLPDTYQAGTCLDSGHLQFWTSMADVFVIRRASLYAHRHFEYDLHNHVGLIITRTSSIQFISSSTWDDTACYEGYPTALLQIKEQHKLGLCKIQAIVLGTITSQNHTEVDEHLSVLLVKVVNGICYRQGWASISVNDWIGLERAWKLITLG